MKTTLLILINLVILATAALTTLYSINHFSDGGCDGGLCGLAIIFHTLPLLFAWLLQMAAFNQSFHKNRSALIYQVLALVITTIVYNLNKSYTMSALDLEPEVLYLMAGISVAIYFRGDFLVDSNTNKMPVPKEKTFPNAHPILDSAIVLWSFYHLFSFIKMIGYLLSDEMSKPAQTLLTALVTITVYVVLILFIYKNRIWALLLFFGLLLYQTAAVLFYNFRTMVETESIMLVIGNLYLLVALLLQFRKSKTSGTDKNNSPA